jgi:hypothetical protein
MISTIMMIICTRVLLGLGRAGPGPGSAGSVYSSTPVHTGIYRGQIYYDRPGCQAVSTVRIPDAKLQVETGGGRGGIGQGSRCAGRATKLEKPPRQQQREVRPFVTAVRCSPPRCRPGAAVTVCKVGGHLESPESLDRVYDCHIPVI